MVQLIVAAFVMGMVGSFHCIGMCGPIALSLPLNQESSWGKFSGTMFYNFGRITTYAGFGLIFGLIGKSVALFGYQQWLSITLGILILVVLILPKKISSYYNRNFIISFFGRLRASIGKLFLKKNYSSLYSIGLLNGLLPCGLVYMAAAIAIATGDTTNSIFFMAFFGLGTLPMMWGIAFFGNYVSIGIRKNIRKAYPYLMTILACLLILRGLGLGIPYVSPKADMAKKAVPVCCEKPVRQD